MSSNDCRTLINKHNFIIAKLIFNETKVLHYIIKFRIQLIGYKLVFRVDFIKLLSIGLLRILVNICINTFNSLTVTNTKIKK